MKSFLSPKELARAIDASESSVKRWIDQGRLSAERTPGGHRRIAMAEIVRFVRSSEVTVQHPELIGLNTAGDSPPASAAHDLADALTQSMLAMTDELTEGLLTRAFLAGADVADLCDGPIRQALHTIGEIWRQRDEGIMIEHRATQACTAFLRRVLAIHQASREAPRAVGGAGPGELHHLPSLMAASVLGSADYRVTDLGGMTPIATLTATVVAERPAIAWLAIHSESTARAANATLAELLDTCETHGTQLIVGGRSADRIAPAFAPRLVQAGSMRELQLYALGRRAS